jgi:hypothetical protein
MRPGLAALAAAAILSAGASAVHATVLCQATYAGFLHLVLKERPGSMCHAGERKANIDVFDCSVCTPGMLSSVGTCEFVEPTLGLGRGSEEPKKTTRQCKLVGYLVMP